MSFSGGNKHAKTIITRQDTTVTHTSDILSKLQKYHQVPGHPIIFLHRNSSEGKYDSIFKEIYKADAYPHEKNCRATNKRQKHIWGCTTSKGSNQWYVLDITGNNYRGGGTKPINNETW